MTDTWKAFIAGVLSGLLGYLEPIANDVFALVYIFILNFVFGFLQGRVVNGEDFSFKKAWRCVLESSVFFILMTAIFVIGKLKGQMDGALQCASSVTWAVLYFYTTNILRNIKKLLKPGHPAWACVGFLYYIMSFEVVKKIPYLSEYLNWKEKDGTAETVSQ